MGVKKILICTIMAIPSKKLSDIESWLVLNSFCLELGALLAVVKECVALAKILCVIGLLFYTIAKVFRLYDILFISSYSVKATIYLVTINILLGGLSGFILVDLFMKFFIGC